MINTAPQVFTTRKRSARLPVIPAGRMTRRETKQWRVDMAQSLQECKQWQPDSRIKQAAELGALEYCAARLDEKTTTDRNIEQSKPAPHGLSLSSDDAAIRGKAELLAKRCEIASNRLMRDLLDEFTEANENGKGEDYALRLAGALFDVVEAVVIDGGSPAPRIMGEDTQAIMAAVRRTWCAKWWRRRLNTDFKRWKEAAAIAAGKVGRGRSAYVSKDALQDRREQLKRNSDLLKAFMAICDDEAVSLEKCAAASVSNPEIRRNEVMCRIRGLEEWADSVGYVSQFWTMTAPSRFHRFRTLKSGRLISNDKWNGATPKEAQAYLVRVWARIRAKLARDDVDMIGFRVVEPHHDGCPHWHMLVFCSPATMAAAEIIVRHYCMQDSPNESGAKKRRFVVEKINRDINKRTGRRNSAVGYIAKYISKNLDGRKGADNEPMGGNSHDGGGTIDENIRKVDAWRSLWGVRQFQFFAAGAVSVWRELRRLRKRPAGKIGSVWETAQGELVAGKDARADWCAFLNQLEKNPVELISARKVGNGQMIESDYRNEYGEFVNQIIGLRCAGVDYQTRLKDWSLIEASEAQRLGLVSITVRADGTKEVSRTGKALNAPPDD